MLGGSQASSVGGSKASSVRGSKASSVGVSKKARGSQTETSSAAKKIQGCDLLQLATSAGLKEQEAIDFLEKKMKNDLEFSYDETVQTAISALQSVLQEDFKASEIQRHLRAELIIIGLADGQEWRDVLFIVNVAVLA
nr:proteasome subunit alpha type-6 [Tanacetum cinerariifolium]